MTTLLHKLASCGIKLDSTNCQIEKGVHYVQCHACIQSIWNNHYVVPLVFLHIIIIPCVLNIMSIVQRLMMCLHYTGCLIPRLAPSYVHFWITQSRACNLQAHKANYCKQLLACTVIFQRGQYQRKLSGFHPYL